MVQKHTQDVKENTQIFEYIYENHPPKGVDLPLATVSDRDSVWDTHRNDTAAVGDIYAQCDEFERYSERMSDCSGYLLFGIGESGLVLKQANFCRVRYCPVCQWRKSLYWKAMMYQKYEQLRKEYPNHRFILLTLTLENPPITELRDTLQYMNKAWQRLIKRKQFGVVDGWIRTTEVTRDTQRPNTHAHPHFHCLLMVKPSYFGKNYLKQMDWVRLWQSCLKVDYLPNVDIRVVKSKGKAKGEPMNSDDVKAGVVETLKYAVKPADIIGDGSGSQASNEWFYELTRQTHRLRFVATGGALKDILKDDDISDKDMITPVGTEEEATDKRRLNFTYYKRKRSYIYNPRFNE